MKSNFNKISSNSIRITLPIMLAVLLIGSTFIIGMLAFRSGKSAINDLANQLTQEISTRIEDHVRTFLDTPHIIHEFNAVAFENMKLDLDNFSEMENIFASQVDLSESAPFIYYGNEDGEFFGIQRDNDKSLILWLEDQTTKPDLVIYQLDNEFNRVELIDRVEFDPRSRPWYQAAVKAGKATWSPIYPDISRPVLIITAVLPVYHKTHFHLQGVMGIELSLEQLSSFLKNLYISKTGQAFIIDRDGNIIASSSNETPYTQSEDGPIRLTASESIEPIIQSTARHLLNEFHDFNTIESKSHLTFSYNDKQQIVQITPFRDNRGIDWLIVVVIPESDLMGPIYTNVQKTMVVGVIVLVITIFLGLSIARWIIRPIIAITDAAKDIESGDYNVSKLENINKRKDELGTLSLVIKNMALEIFIREQRLKEQVQKLRIQIDDNKRRIQVNEITETDFFRELRLKAQDMRKQRMKNSDDYMEE